MHIECFRHCQQKPGAEVNMESSGKCNELTVLPLGEERSWENIVDDDERMMLESCESCFGDENEDCKIMNKEFESFRMQDGYQSQPRTATCNKSQRVKWFLTFDRSQIGNEDLKL